MRSKRSTRSKARPKRRLHLKWSTANRKLRKTKTVSFNLPAFRSQDGFAVCPMAGGCATLCYARQGRYTMPDAKRTRERNLRVVRGDLERFERWAIEDLARLPHESVRLHDSGDFFSQAYLDSWIRVIAATPGKRFYCYTKSLHLDWRAVPANFTVVQSVGGKLDEQIDRERSHSRIFASHAEREAAGYVDGNVNDSPAQQGVTKIGLVYHGSYKLRPGQVLWLRQAAA